MSRFSLDDLRTETLRRQFPPPAGHGPGAVLQLFDRLGPIQSQVPRSPFLAASSRLPGTTYAEVRDLFGSFSLLKTTNLRGTVHTTGRSQFGWADAVSRRSRRGALSSQLVLSRVTAEELVAEVEAWTADAWRPRAEIVEHVHGWLAEHESAASAAAVTSPYVANLVWGHSGLVRRPKDDRWERRTDTFHHRAKSLGADLACAGLAEALAGLVRVHLTALGPASRQDLGYFLGTTLGLVDSAVAGLGEQVVRHRGPDGQDLLDVADPPDGAFVDPGVRLLPEFDALLVGYHGHHRGRFLDAAELSRVWAKSNGQYSPTVLHEGRIAATWRTVTTARGTVVEVTALPGHHPLPEDELAVAAADLGRVLDLDVTDVRLR